MIPSLGVFFNDANNRAHTALLGQVWLHLTVINLHNRNEGGQVRACLGKYKHIYAVPLFVISSCWPNVLKNAK